MLQDHQAEIHSNWMKNLPSKWIPSFFDRGKEGQAARGTQQEDRQGSCHIWSITEVRQKGELKVSVWCAS